MLASSAGIANKYAGEACTLDGLPAKLTGRLMPFAEVVQLGSSFKVEFSWSAVERIMQTGGEFES